jgi:hypothetical protein
VAGCPVPSVPPRGGSRIAIPLCYGFGGSRELALLWIAPGLIAFALLTLAAARGWPPLACSSGTPRHPRGGPAHPLLGDAHLLQPRHGPLRVALFLNPLSSFIEAMRDALLQAHAPSQWQLALMAGWLALIAFSGDPKKLDVLPHLDGL